ncbi:hypothetical protein KY362_01245 [Candidatus Woesearchaeota archaeon]|nr:hypothetical protein [Candidatus Woesearchaeota archaeon]
MSEADFARNLDRFREETAGIKVDAAEGRTFFDRYMDISSEIGGVCHSLASTGFDTDVRRHPFIEMLMKFLIGESVEMRESRLREEHEAAIDSKLSKLAHIQQRLDDILAETYDTHHDVGDYVLLRDDAFAMRVGLVKQKTPEAVRLDYLVKGNKSQGKLIWSQFDPDVVKCRLKPTTTAYSRGPVAVYTTDRLETFAIGELLGNLKLGHYMGGFKVSQLLTKPVVERRQVVTLEPVSRKGRLVDVPRIIAELSQSETGELPFFGAKVLIEEYRAGGDFEEALDSVYHRDFDAGDLVVAYVDAAFIVGKVENVGGVVELAGGTKVERPNVVCVLMERTARTYDEVPTEAATLWIGEEDYYGFLEHYQDDVRLLDRWPGGEPVNTGFMDPTLSRLLPLRKNGHQMYR